MLFDLFVGACWLTVGVLVVIAGLNLFGWLQDVIGEKAILATFFSFVALFIAWAVGFIVRVV